MIKGLTDKPIIRRDGKIRGGVTDARGFPVNTDYFVLADAPQLIPVLGEKPKEIYFTFFFDDVNAVAPSSLRWYKKSELVCLGNGETAAYMANGDLPGLKQQEAKLRFQNVDGTDGFTTMPRSRERICAYKDCPNYKSGTECSEHTDLRMVIPHYSMAAWFDHTNTSINGLLNIMGAIDKVRLSRGKISGEIFRIYKDKMSLPYENTKTGQKSRSDRDVVFMENVPFDKYMELYKAKIKPEDLNTLMNLRNSGMILPTRMQYLGMGPVDSNVQIEGPTSATPTALPPPTGLAAAATQTEEDKQVALQKMANDPAAAPVFEEIAKLTGKENSEEMRIKTARNFASTDRMIDYLRKKIAEVKKAQKKNEDAAAPAVEQAGPPPVLEGVVLPPQAAQAAAAPAVQAGGLF